MTAQPFLSLGNPGLRVSSDKPHGVDADIWTNVLLPDVEELKLDIQSASSPPLTGRNKLIASLRFYPRPESPGVGWLSAASCLKPTLHHLSRLPEESGKGVRHLLPQTLVEPFCRDVREDFFSWAIQESQMVPNPPFELSWLGGSVR